MMGACYKNLRLKGLSMECITTYSYLDLFRNICTVIVFVVAWCAIAGYVGCNLGKAAQGD
jgi:hypothetical protein